MDVIIPDSHKNRFEESNGIVKIPAEILRQRAVEVDSVSGEETELGIKMSALMARNKAVGLAAPQIGVPKRVVVIKNVDAQTPVPIIMFNPVIVETKGEQFGVEGCLSIPGLWGEVKRHESILVEYMNFHGNTVKVRYKGFLAVIIQHEVDHLDGILFTDRADPNTLTWK